MDNEYLNIDSLETQADSHSIDNQEEYDDWVDEANNEPSKMHEHAWLSDIPFEETEIKNTLNQPFDTSGLSDGNWSSASNGLNNNVETENTQNSQDNMTSSEISFTGYGRCECGCGSFGGHGDICTYCGHPYSAHSRYKK